MKAILIDAERYTQAWKNSQFPHPHSMHVLWIMFFENFRRLSVTVNKSIFINVYWGAARYYVEQTVHRCV